MSAVSNDWHRSIYSRRRGVARRRSGKSDDATFNVVVPGRQDCYSAVIWTDTDTGSGPIRSDPIRPAHERFSAVCLTASLDTHCVALRPFPFVTGILKRRALYIVCGRIEINPEKVASPSRTTGCWRLVPAIAGSSMLTSASYSSQISRHVLHATRNQERRHLRGPASDDTQLSEARHKCRARPDEENQQSSLRPVSAAVAKTVTGTGKTNAHENRD